MSRAPLKMRFLTFACGLTIFDGDRAEQIGALVERSGNRPGFSQTRSCRGTPSWVYELASDILIHGNYDEPSN